MSPRRFARLRVIAPALALTLVPVAAHAAVGGSDTTFGVSASDSSAVKSATATCPAGRRVLGTGALLQAGDQPDLMLDDIRPSADLTSATVNVFEDESGTAADWTASAYALCAPPLPGLERVAATSALNSANKSATATCPAGKRVVGAGADVNSFNGQVFLDDLRPNAALTSVTANGVEDETGNPINWSITAYAVCAQAPAGLERASETSALDSSGFKVIFNACPSGKVLIGLGADVNTFNGQVGISGIFYGGGENIVLGAIEDDTGNPVQWSLTSYLICANGSRLSTLTSFADSSPKNVNIACTVAGHEANGFGGAVLTGNREVVMDRWRRNPANNMLTTAFEDDGGNAGDWQLTSHAVCTTPLPSQEQVEAVTAKTSANKSVTAACPTGKRVVGGTAEIFDGLGQVILDDVRPNAALTSVTANGIEDGSGTTRTWTITARAVCAQPPPGLERAAVSTVVDTSGFKFARASCPGNKTLLGTGYDLNTFNGEVLVQELAPNADLTSVSLSATADADGNALPWGATAYAICATP